MTKEHKLALIVGFALVLVVGVLISDHFSKASSAVLNDELTARDPRAYGASTGELNGSIMQPPPITPEEQIRREELARGTQMQPLPGLHKEPEPVLAHQSIQPENGLAGMFDDANPNTLVMGEHQGQAAVDANFDPVRHIEPLMKQDPPSGFTPVREQQPVSGSGYAQPPVRHTQDPMQNAGMENPRPTPQPPAPVDPPAPVMRHSVGEGESLFAIARKYYGDGSMWNRIRDANPKSVEKDGSVRAGVMLIIPTPPSKVAQPQQPTATARAETKPDAAKADAKPSDKPVAQPSDAPKPKRDNAVPGKLPASAYAMYTVKPGDTLSRVAQKLLKTSKRADDIAMLNKLDDPDHLVVGMQLKIPPL